MIHWRQLIVSVLLLLLPLQATAVVMACPHAGAMDVTMNKAAADKPAVAAPESAMMAMEDCPMRAQSGSPARDAGTTQDDPAPNACCASATACAMCGLAATVRPFSAFAQSGHLTGVLLSVQFTSFIPEGLQRPPSLFA